jgi:glycosyltransferase involved in cell wall biosynthesis
MNLWAILKGAKNLSQFLKKHQVDLVVTKGLVTHIYGGVAARITNIPCTWHLQDFISERYFGLYTKIFGQIAEHLPHHIIVDGGPIAGQLPSSLQKNVTVIFNGVDTSVFNPNANGRAIREEFGISQDAVLIGNVARFTPWKGQHHLLNAFALVSKKMPNAYLLLVGSPVFDKYNYERRLRKRAERVDLKGRVLFAGYRYDLPAVLSAIDIFTYTAVEKDTSPLVLLSAMATGLPTIAFAIDGILEIVNDRQEGILVPSKDENKFAKALVEVYQNYPLRTQLATNARQTAVKLFDVRLFAENCQAVFNLTQNRN